MLYLKDHQSFISSSKSGSKCGRVCTMPVPKTAQTSLLKLLYAGILKCQRSEHKRYGICPDIISIKYPLCILPTLFLTQPNRTPIKSFFTNLVLASPSIWIQSYRMDTVNNDILSNLLVRIYNLIKIKSFYFFIFNQALKSISDVNF